MNPAAVVDPMGLGPGLPRPLPPAPRVKITPKKFSDLLSPAQNKCPKCMQGAAELVKAIETAVDSQPEQRADIRETTAFKKSLMVAWRRCSAGCDLA